MSISVSWNLNSLLDLSEKLAFYVDEGNSLDPAAYESKLTFWTTNGFSALLRTLSQQTVLSDLIACRECSKLCNLYRYALLDFSPPQNLKQFYVEIFPECLSSLIAASHRIQAYYISIPNFATSERKSVLDCLVQCVTSLTQLVKYHSDLCLKVLENDTFMAMLIVDDNETEALLLNLFTDIVLYSRNSLHTVNKHTLNSFLDEIIYKLTSASDSVVGRAGLNAILAFCDAVPALFPLFQTRYRGLRPLMSRWLDMGFNRDLKRFFDMLDAKTAERLKIDKVHLAATVIQAHWRRYASNKRLSQKRQEAGMAEQQARDLEAKRHREYEQKQAELTLKHQLLTSRKQAQRRLREKQLMTISSLPPAIVDNYLKEEQNNAAKKIQALYKGYCIRKHMSETRVTLREIRSIVRIQRCVRKWLQQVKLKRLLREQSLQKPHGLTDKRRVEIHQEIRQYQTEHPITARTAEQQKALHEKCQDYLQSYFLAARSNRRLLASMPATLACLEADSDLVIGAATLASIDEKQLGRYSSHSRSAVYHAKQMHKEQVSYTSRPWFKKLDCIDSNDPWAAFEPTELQPDEYAEVYKHF